MKITRHSQLTGIKRTLDLPITEAQLRSFKGGTLIQDAFPDLDPDQREFIMTGITAEEWDAAFPPEDEDDA